MNPTINDFMLSLIEELQTKGVAESTATTYVRNLYTLNNKRPFKNLAFLRNKNQIEATMRPYADSTKKTLLASIVSVLGMYKTKRNYGKLYDYYQGLMNEKKKEMDAKPKNVRNEKQEKHWISWDSVKEKLENLKDAVEDFRTKRTISTSQRQKLLEYLLLSLFTRIPPRRNQDYAQMYVVKKATGDLPEDKNYYVIDDKKLIFNKYKTAKTYGQQTIDISKNRDLLDALNLYVRHHVSRPSRWGKNSMFPLLVKGDGSPLSSVNGITRLLHKILGKNVGASMLRHIYLTSKYGDELEDMKRDATAMGHSLAEQKEYIKNDDPDEKEDNPREGSKEA
jgi:integrase